ncbi:hypothetical protein E2C01_000350 [Portunus trituberculatus]|uniref:Uncharacterized protein n=1 Tax=Portunus trituberculatus TaxID=210409 RepID=A0A5B7CJD5_PORTR|nr:hypothetical protein [Portunus trituberculatus]
MFCKFEPVLRGNVKHEPRVTRDSNTCRADVVTVNCARGRVHHIEVYRLKMNRQNISQDAKADQFPIFYVGLSDPLEKSLLKTELITDIQEDKRRRT